MKSEWATHIRETREKVNRKRRREKKDEVSYREAMKLASLSWEAKKKKLERKWKREGKTKVIKTKKVIKTNKGDLTSETEVKKS